MQIRRLGILLLLLGLSGCDIQQQIWKNGSGHHVAADPLDAKLVSNDALQNVHTGDSDYVGRIVNDSETKCAEFVDRLVLSETATNSTLDILTTVFSALGTAFTPLGTVHALTAASTITSGSKTAIDADIYAKASIANFAQAIQSTYYKDIGNYVAALRRADPATVNPSIEVNVIRPIHAECALAPAEATISASLKGTQPQADASTSDTVITVTKAPQAAAASYTLKGAGTGVSISITYSASMADDMERVAAKMVGRVNASPDFQNAGVRAAQQAGTATFTLSTPAAAGIKWTVSTNMSLASAGAPGDGAAIAGVIPMMRRAGPRPAPAGTSGVQFAPVVPGHAVN